MSESIPAVLDDIERNERRYPNDSVRLLAVTEELTDWGRVKRYRGCVTPARYQIALNRGLVTHDDLAFLESIGTALAELTEDEIQAIGRHETSRNTHDAIIYEFGRWRLELLRLCTLLARMPDNGFEDESWVNRLAEAAWRPWSSARECVLKSHVERGPYLTGYEKFVRALGAELRPAFEQDREEMEDIWEAADVATLRLPSYGVLRCSEYLVGCLVCHPALGASFKRPTLDQSRVVESYGWTFSFVSNSCDMYPYIWTPPAALQARVEPSVELIQPEEFWDAGEEGIERLRTSALGLIGHLSTCFVDRLVHNTGLEESLKLAADDEARNSDWLGDYFVDNDECFENE